jgi:trehalose/maltose hydrolase-like predicted phosphorylase
MYHFLHAAEIFQYTQNVIRKQVNISNVKLMTIIIKNSLFQVQAHQCSAHRAELYTGSVLELCSAGALFDSR